MTELATEDLTPELARHILDRMGSTGQPPERGARHVNVATEKILEVLRDEYLRPMAKTGRNSTFKLIQAPFGGGKTHFLHCLRELSWSEGFCTALVGLSPKECPFDRPVSIYREVARRVELPVSELDTEPEAGLDRVLRRVAVDRLKEIGEPGYRTWLRTEFASAQIESRSYGRAVLRFLEAVVDGDFDAEEVLGDYLRGESLRNDELAPYRLRETLDDENGFRFLRSLVQSLAALGLPGLVMMFDEMDRNMSLSTRRRRDIGDNLRQMIDACGQSLLPGVIWAYAVPPEFMDTVVPEYPALAQRLKGATHFSAQSPLQPIIDLDHLPLGTTELLTSIGQRLADLSELAHGHKFEAATQAANIRELARELGERSFESGTRRTFVKAAVTMLENQRREGDRALEADEIRGLAGALTTAGPELMPGEAEF